MESETYVGDDSGSVTENQGNDSAVTNEVNTSTAASEGDGPAAAAGEIASQEAAGKPHPLETLDRVDRELKALKDEWENYKAKFAAMGVHPDRAPEAEVSAAE